MSRRVSPVSYLSQSSSETSPTLSSESLYLDGRYNVETFIRTVVEKNQRTVLTDNTVITKLQKPSLKLKAKE